jgi:hypothetical protein
VQQADEQPAPVVEERPDLSTIKHAEATPTVSWTCPECSSPVTVQGKRLLFMVLQGQGAIVKCPAPSCSKFVAVDGPRPDKPLVQPATLSVTNRQGRRAMEALSRRGLIHSK